MKFLDYDPFFGVSTFFSHDSITGKNVLQSIQDVEPILEMNQSLLGTLNKKENWWHVGTIPMVICQQWAQECGAKPFSKAWQAYAMKQLNLPDYRKLNPNKIKL